MTAVSCVLTRILSGTSLRKLKEKLKAERKHLDELDSHIKELESQAGGEQQ